MATHFEISGERPGARLVASLATSSMLHSKLRLAAPQFGARAQAVYNCEMSSSWAHFLGSLVQHELGHHDICSILLCLGYSFGSGPICFHTPCFLWRSKSQLITSLCFCDPSSLLGPPSLAVANAATATIAPPCNS